MIGRKLTPNDLKKEPITVQLEHYILEDLKKMSTNAKIPLDEIIKKATLMFIATHNDYLGHR